MLLIMLLLVIVDVVVVVVVESRLDAALLENVGEQPTNLLVTFLQYSSIVMQDIRRQCLPIPFSLPPHRSPPPSPSLPSILLLPLFSILPPASPSLPPFLLRPPSLHPSSLFPPSSLPHLSSLRSQQVSSVETFVDFPD